MAAGLLLVFFIFVMTPLLEGYPITRAFMAGLEAARDPANRATPQSAWHFFRHAAWGKLRRWVVLWLGLFAALLATVLIAWGPGFGPYFAVAWLTAVCATVALLHAAYCWIFSPRLKSFAALMVGGAIVSLLVMLALWIGFSLLPRPWSSISFTQEVAITGGRTTSVTARNYATAQIWSCGIALIVYTIARWRARRRGAAWFRFEE